MKIAIDQYGQMHKIEGKHTRKELMELFGSCSAQKMYIDTKEGESKHVGYIIKGLWLTVFDLVGG